MKSKIIYQDTIFETEQDARWAVFFSHLGIEWEYQPPAEVLSNGTIFKAAFWLPTFDGGMTVNVCAEEYSVKTRMMEADYCIKTGKAILHANGWPCRPRVLTFYCVHDGAVIERVGLPNANAARDQDRMFIEPGFQDENGLIQQRDYDVIGEEYVGATISAACWAFYEVQVDEEG